MMAAIEELKGKKQCNFNDLFLKFCKQVQQLQFQPLW